MKNSPLTISPTADRLLVERDPPIKTTSGGIEIPDKALERMRTGTILARGDHVTDERLDINAKVLFGEHAGIPTPLGGKDLLIMDQGEILAILSENETRD